MILIVKNCPHNFHHTGVLSSKLTFVSFAFPIEIKLQRLPIQKKPPCVIKRSLPDFAVQCVRIGFTVVIPKHFPRFGYFLPDFSLLRRRYVFRHFVKDAVQKTAVILWHPRKFALWRCNAALLRLNGRGKECECEKKNDLFHVCCVLCCVVNVMCFSLFHRTLNGHLTLLCLCHVR